MAEAGVKGFFLELTFGLVVASSTPRDVVTALNSRLQAALTSRELVQRFQDFSFEASASTPEEFGKVIQREREFYQTVVRETGIQID